MIVSIVTTLRSVLIVL